MHTDAVTQTDTGHQLTLGPHAWEGSAIPSFIFCSETKACQAQTGLELAIDLPQSLL